MLGLSVFRINRKASQILERLALVVVPMQWILVTAVKEQTAEDPMQIAKELLEKFQLEARGCKAGLDVDSIPVVYERFEKHANERYAVCEAHVEEKDDDCAFLSHTLIAFFAKDKVLLAVDLP